MIVLFKKRCPRCGTTMRNHNQQIVYIPAYDGTYEIKIFICPNCLLEITQEKLLYSS